MRPDLLIIGLSHRTAPVALREKLAVPAESVEPSLKQITGLPGVREAVLVSTCNRVEIYAAGPDVDAALDAVRAHLGARAGVTEAELVDHLYHRVGDQAVHHLFRVAASLDSLVVGEPQILGQVKDAWDTAERVGTIGPTTGLVFPRAFRVARRVRRDTTIARNPTSVSSVAVELARQVFGGFEGRSVLVVGAGKMSDLAGRAFRAQGASLVVTNRTAARADDLAARIGCTVHPWADLAGALTRADVVLSSTGAREPVITRALLSGIQRARRGRPLVLVDIAVPRDIEPGCAELEGVYLFDIDDLQKVASAHLDDRRGEADRAEVMVEEEMRRFLAALESRNVGPTIAALRTRFLGVARGEAEKVLAGMPALGDKEKRAVAVMAEQIVNKLLHAPQMAMKRSASADGALVEAVRELFELPAVAAAPAPDDDDDGAAAGPAAEADKAAGS